MGFVCVHVGSFLHRVASPFHSFVTMLIQVSRRMCPWQDPSGVAQAECLEDSAKPKRQSGQLTHIGPAVGSTSYGTQIQYSSPVLHGESITDQASPRTPTQRTFQPQEAVQPQPCVVQPTLRAKTSGLDSVRPTALVCRGLRRPSHGLHGRPRAPARYTQVR